MIVYIILWAGVVAAALWLYLRQVHTRFSRHGVKNLPAVPLFGNALQIFLRKEHFAEQLDTSYKAFPGERFIGRYEFTAPLILVKDIELMKKVTVKDFEHFTDHRSLVNEDTDPLFGRNLFSLKGDEWKDMRSTLSPAFTSSKMRLMLPFMVNAGKQMIESLKAKMKTSNNNYIDVDVKDLTTRYTNDVIATCAFGLDVNSHVDENNQFYKMGKEAVNFKGFLTFMKFVFFLVFPRLMAKLNISLFSEKVKQFFKNVVMDTMKHREERNIVRPDMIHLLMEAKKGRLVHDDNISDADAGFATVEESNVGKKKIDREWSDNDLAAQAILFFIAGFETVSAGMSFALHELALHPDVQDKLVQEIRETDQRNGGKFQYNTIQNMKYLDMVVSEVLRLWPPALQLERMCVKDYNLGKANDDPATKDYYIRVGEALIIPAYSVHRDPEFYAEPLKFDPERFSDENKHNIQPFAYMPFGTGPRNCIGSRFALCELKVLLYQLLLSMEVTPNEKTCVPTKLDPKSFNFGPIGGFQLRFKIRS